jgi:hypothetical protein
VNKLTTFASTNKNPNSKINHQLKPKKIKIRFTPNIQSFSFHTFNFGRGTPLVKLEIKTAKGSNSYPTQFKNSKVSKSVP